VIAVVPVRAGELPLGGDEAVAEAGGRALLVGVGTEEAAAQLRGIAHTVRTWERGSYAPAAWAETLAAIVADEDVVVLPASREIVVPTPIGEIVRSGRCFVHRTARREVPLPLPGDVVAGSTLCGGAAMAGGAVVALETRGRSGMHLLVVDLERVALVARLRLTGVSRVVWVEDSVQAVLVRDRSLTAIELRRGRHLGTHIAESVVGTTLSTISHLDVSWSPARSNEPVPSRLAPESAFSRDALDVAALGCARLLLPASRVATSPVATWRLGVSRLPACGAVP